MKILLKYFPDRAQQIEGETAESSVRAVFVSLADLIRLKSLNVLGRGEDGGNFDLIEIEVVSQFGVSEDQSVANKVREAIAWRSELVLIDMKLKRRVEFDAIQMLDERTYRVDPSFALFVAKHDKYREELKTDNIMFARCEYEQLESSVYAATGKVSSQSKRGSNTFNPNNIYNCFAVALSAADDFRAQILASDLLEVILTMNEQSLAHPQGAVTMSLVPRNQFKFFIPVASVAARAEEVEKPVAVSRHAL